MLTPDCVKRISCAEMAKHPWLKKVPEQYPNLVPQKRDFLQLEEEDGECVNSG